MQMRHYRVTIEIAAPADRVWAVLSDVDQWHQWTPSVTGVHWLGSREFAVGGRVVIRQPGFPPAMWTIDAIQPGRWFIWTSRAPGLRVVGRHVVEATRTGSRVTLSLDMQGWLGGFWGWLTRSRTERYIQYEAHGLKARSENPAFQRVDLAA